MGVRANKAVLELVNDLERQSAVEVCPMHGLRVSWCLNWALEGEELWPKAKVCSISMPLLVGLAGENSILGF